MAPRPPAELALASARVPDAMHSGHKTFLLEARRPGDERVPRTSPAGAVLHIGTTKCPRMRTIATPSSKPARAYDVADPFRHHPGGRRSRRGLRQNRLARHQ